MTGMTCTYIFMFIDFVFLNSHSISFFSIVLWTKEKHNRNKYSHFLAGVGNNWNFWRQQRTHSSCGDGDGDGSDEGEIVAWINAVPQGRQEESQCQLVLGGSVVTHPEERGGIPPASKMFEKQEAE